MQSALDRISTEVGNLLMDYRVDLHEAWLKSEDGLTISFSAKIKPGNCEVTMTFTKSKVKDSISFPWEDKQISLLDQQREEVEEDGTAGETKR